MGWSIDSVDIARKNVQLCWAGNPEWICFSDEFTLTLNGASHALHLRRLGALAQGHPPWRQ
jgi:hypothetical protein